MVKGQLSPSSKYICLDQGEDIEYVEENLSPLLSNNSFDVKCEINLK